METALETEKILVDESRVRHLVAAQFPQWADLPIRRVEPQGWDNYTFHLGHDKTVRLPSAERYSQQVKKEQKWLPVLAPLLPLPIPVPLAMGAPTQEYPWNWSIYKWIEGESATLERIAAPSQFAISLAQFLIALQKIDPTDGPAPGTHNFFRGGSLRVYDAETRHAIAILNGKKALKDKIHFDIATEVWEAAIQATWNGSPVWLHGDVAEGNLLVREGNLSAVIDFGSSGIGDKAFEHLILRTSEIEGAEVEWPYLEFGLPDFNVNRSGASLAPILLV